MKMYSKRFLTAALALGMCIGMAACGEDKLADETTAETTAVTTTTPETTAKTTVETTAPETEEEKIGINQDLVAEYGQTFAEISAKHGKIVEYKILDGGASYQFETGYGWYFFYNTDYMNPSAWGTIEDTDEKIPLPDDDYKCIVISGIRASDLFNNSFDSLSIDELSKIDGITVTVNKASDEYYNYEGYDIQFKYDGFSHEKLGFTEDSVVFLSHVSSEDKIEPNTYISIYLLPEIASKYISINK